MHMNQDKHDALMAAIRQGETGTAAALLEDQAAGEFFNQLLASGVSGARAPWVEASWAEKYYKSGSLTGRLGLRVIAPLFDVHDDPHELRDVSGDPRFQDALVRMREAYARFRERVEDLS